MASAEKREEQRPYHHGDLRRALLDAALGALARGEDELSFRQLAAEAGVARSAPYHHFRDRGELLAVIAGEGFGLLRERLAAAALTGMNDLRAVEALAKAYVAFGRAHLGHYRVMFLPIVTRPENVAHVHPPAQACFDLLELALNRADPLVEPRTVTRRARAIWSALHGLVLLGQAGGPLRLERDEEEDEFISALASSLAKP